ncbi:Nmad5 family putative nucleotide modification protein [Gilliamella mensalis]|uniref:Nmad5 family putative nucleotide modification protein n=1 Tax=Gilliamella mensalis TaxID=1908520 RepID=UPI000A149118|nr:Nmad5 family putative nucleotide modification protein [Gilliamella mensalis]
MTRLNKDIKAKILQNAINAAPVTKRLEEIEAMKYQLAVDIYDSVTAGHNPNEYARQLREIVEKSPFYLGLLEDKTDVAEQDYIICAFGGMQEYLYFPDDGKTRYKVARKNLRFTADHDFSIRFTKIEPELKKCEEERDSLGIDIQTILNSCSTAAQLEKFWPASVNFLEGCEVCAEIKGVPVVLVNDLNAKLGIYA